MTTNQSTKRRGPQHRSTQILTIIHDHPGLDALALRVHGLRPSDGRVLREMEEVQNVVAYKNGGWHLTAKGDRRLLEVSEDTFGADVQADG